MNAFEDHSILLTFIQSLDEALTQVTPPANNNELRIRGQGTVIGSVATKRRLDTENGTAASPSILNAEQGLSVRGAATLLPVTDAMDVDDVRNPAASPGQSEPPRERQTSQGHKRRRGLSDGADETHPAATSAGAISPQQKMESPSLLSRLQGTSSTASPQVSTSKQTSGSTLTGLAARLSPNIANLTSNTSPLPTTGYAPSIAFAARLGTPSSANSNRTTLSSDTSQSARNIAYSHDHSSKRTSASASVGLLQRAHTCLAVGSSDRGIIVPSSTGQPRKRFVRRGLSIQGAASLATDPSRSLNDNGDEIRIRGAAQRITDDYSDGSDRRQVSLLARLGDGGGGNPGISGVGAGGHRNRK